MNYKIEIDKSRRARPQKLKLGIFIEDISHALDGGLYAELLQNRAFEFDSGDNETYTPMTAWETSVNGESQLYTHIETAHSRTPQNPHYIVIEANKLDLPSGIRNLGYAGGIGVTADAMYRFRMYARLAREGAARVMLALTDESGAVYAEAVINVGGTDWTEYKACLCPTDGGRGLRLELLLMDTAEMYVDMVSLMPADTYKGRANGLNRRLAEPLEAMKPAFVRFPGGCLVHCGSLDAGDRSSMYRWKNSIGKPENRPSRHSPIWKYNQTLGVGYMEFFLLCEDIGAEPMPVLPAGYDPHTLRAAGLSDMREWIDDALDLIEFANGGTDTKWGAVRAELGHPEPFGLKYLMIGNEEVGAPYFERYALIADAVKVRHPEIKLFNSAIVGKFGHSCVTGVQHARKTGAYCADVHNYDTPEWFFSEAERYDKPLCRQMLGEYSSRGETLYNAIAEAAFLTNIEMTGRYEFACYAPLLCNVNYINWQTNLINFDAYTVAPTPSYHVQRMFMTNAGHMILPCTDDIGKTAFAPLQMLDGDILLRSDLGHMEVSDLVLNGADGTPIDHVQRAAVTPDAPLARLCHTDATAYTLLFDFMKTKGQFNPMRRGKYAFNLEIGVRDDCPGLTWSIGGWQDCVLLDGRPGTVLRKSELSLEPGVRHRAKVTVDGARVRCFIDGRLTNEYILRPEGHRDIYYSCVEAEDGGVIFKTVNAADSENSVTLVPGGHIRRANVSVLKGEKTAVNTLEHPDNIVPETYTLGVDSEALTLSLAPWSVTVIRMDR